MVDKYYFEARLSKSQFKSYRRDGNNAEFWSHCMLNPNRVEQEDNDAMALGRLFHLFVLGDEEGKKDLWITDTERGLSSRATKTFQDLIKANPDKFVVKQSELDLAKRAEAVAREYCASSRLLEGLQVEYSVLWDYVYLPLKCKLDGWKLTNQGIVAVEYKTTSNLNKTRWSLDSNGWDLDVGFQALALESEGKDIAKFIFLVQDSKTPENIITYSVNYMEEIEECKEMARLKLDHFRLKYDEWKKTCDDKVWRPKYAEREFQGYNGRIFSLDFLNEKEMLKLDLGIKE